MNCQVSDSEYASSHVGIKPDSGPVAVIAKVRHGHLIIRVYVYIARVCD
jgi:hypothetical protein